MTENSLDIFLDNLNKDRDIRHVFCSLKHAHTFNKTTCQEFIKPHFPKGHKTKRYPLKFIQKPYLNSSYIWKLPKKILIYLFLESCYSPHYKIKISQIMIEYMNQFNKS